MKKAITLFAAITFTVTGFTQKIDVREASENLGGGSHNSLSVMVAAKSKGDVEDAMRSFFKDLDGKTNSSKGEYMGDDCKVKAMGDNTFDIYGKVEEVKGEGFKMMIAVDLGGAYMSSSQHSSQFKIMKDKVYDLAVKIQKDGIGADLKEAEKLLEKQEEAQKDLEDDKKDLQGDIEDYKKKITEAETKIKENESAQEKKKEEISAQKKVVEEVKKKMEAVK
jgi:hypothetical protein